MEYSEIWGMVMAELTDLNIHRLREQDTEFDALVKKRIELSNCMEQAKESMDGKTKQLIGDYNDTVEDINSRQIEFFYLQGAKDCFRLLKSFGLI